MESPPRPLSAEPLSGEPLLEPGLPEVEAVKKKRIKFQPVCQVFQLQNLEKQKSLRVVSCISLSIKCKNINQRTGRTCTMNASLTRLF